jgi:hypothetical protein
MNNMKIIFTNRDNVIFENVSEVCEVVEVEAGSKVRFIQGGVAQVRIFYSLIWEVWLGDARVI